MASKQLQDKFLSALQSSPVFQRLNAREQMEIRDTYIHSSDEEILNAIDSLHEADRMDRNVQQEITEIEEQKIVLVSGVKDSFRKLKRVELEVAEAADADLNSANTEQLIADIEPKTPVQKPKKLFGIF